MVPKICSRCGGFPFRRVNRIGWLERVLLPKLGYYPWECVQCRVRRLFLDSGEPSGKRQPLVD